MTKDDQPIIYDDDARKYFNMTGSVKNYTFDDKKESFKELFSGSLIETMQYRWFQNCWVDLNVYFENKVLK